MKIIDCETHLRSVDLDEDDYLRKPYADFSIPDGGAQLGVARVDNVAGNRVLLQLKGERIWALMATAFPYRPVVGDTVLAISQGKENYIIGVVNGTGKTTFTAPGDLEFCAPRGRIELESAKGVQVRSPEVKISARKFELFVSSIFEKCDEATRWIKNALQLRAGSVRTRVDETYDLKAKRVVERAEEDVKIDGQKIRLG